MGCRDQQSNFQRLRFRDGEWGALWGMDPTWEGPIEEVKKGYFPELAEPEFVQGDFKYSVERIENDAALVKPLGRIAVNFEPF